MKTILFVCSGNYCRSPLAEGLARLRLKQAGYDTSFSTRSAGTLPEYEGRPRAPLIQEVLREIGAEGQANPPHRITPGESEQAVVIFGHADFPASRHASRTSTSTARFTLSTNRPGVAEIRRLCGSP